MSEIAPGATRRLEIKPNTLTKAVREGKLHKPVVIQGKPSEKKRQLQKVSAVPLTA
jgi:hypothetical protein